MKDGELSSSHTPGGPRALAALGSRGVAPAVGVAVLALYGLTLYPGLAGGDSGELAAAVATGGVIHPPGYPLYALLGGLFTHLPLGAGVAWRLNLLSAACDAAAAALLCAAVTRWARSAAAGVAAASVFALAPVVWRCGVCAEVFALNNLLCALLWLLAVLYDDKGERRIALWGALVVGLGLSNHHTFVFVAAPLAGWALWRGRRDLLQPRNLALLGLAVAVGLLPYAYLPIAAGSASPVSWGEAGSWSGFWTHVLRREYGTFRLAAAGVAPGASGLATLGAWGEAALEAVGWWGAILPLAGAAVGVAAWRRAPLGAVVLLALALSVGALVVLGNLPVSDGLHRGIVARFWQEPGLLVAVLSGAGVAAFERSERRWHRTAVRVVVAVILLAPLPGRFVAMNRHASTLVRAYGAEILRAAPAGALLVTKGDLITNTVRYLQAVEGVRPDVRVVDQELLGYAWSGRQVERLHPEIAIPGARYMPGAADGFTMKALLDANVGAAPVLVCGGVKEGDASADAAYGRWPSGLCERVARGDEPVNVDEWLRESEQALPRIDFRGQPRPEGSWEAVVWGDCWEVRQARAAHLLALAGADPARRRFIGIAADILQGIVDENPAAPAHVYRNLAVALGRQGLDTDEQRARAARAWRRYLELAPAGDPQRAAIEREVARLAR
jgi:hypothetical protein